MAFDGAIRSVAFFLSSLFLSVVTNAALANAISGTSRNTNAVSTLGLVVSDPPTQGEMQTLVNKVDELILALRN